MSWLTDFVHNPGQMITHHPWKSLALLAAPAAAIAAPFAAPALAGAAGIGAAEAGAAGLGAAEAGGLAGLAGEGALGAEAGLAGLGGEAAGGLADSGLSAFAAADLPGGAAPSSLLDFAGEAVPYQNIGGLPAGTSDFAAAGGEAGFDTAAKSTPGFFDKLVSGATDSVTRNPLGIAAAGAGLGMNFLRGSPTDPNQQKLQQQATELGEQGKVLRQYLSDGTLPPGLQAQLDTATQAAKARIVANHAKNGMSTDPAQNSALAQELSAVDTHAVAAMGQMQLDLMKTGLNETGLSTQLYEMLTKMDRQNNQDLMSAIANFAAALGGGTKAPVFQLKQA